MDDISRALRSECEQLARDFGRMFSLDVTGQVVTERRATFSRKPGKRSKPMADDLLRRSTSTKSGLVAGGGSGIKLQCQGPQTIEEWEQAELFYDVTGAPVVNSVGQSLILEPGWSTLHTYELGGDHASKAVELLTRTSEWACRRWGRLSRMLWPERGTEASLYCWLDVVNRVSEIANNATLPSPEWSVVVGQCAWWPVAMWKSRDDWQLGEPRYTADDVERIGEEPELVYCRRANWIQDSETVLEWLVTMLPSDERATATTALQAENDSVNQAALSLVSDALARSGIPGLAPLLGKVSSAEQASVEIIRQCEEDNRKYSWPADRWASVAGVTKATIVGNRSQGKPACRGWLHVLEWRASNKKNRKPVFLETAKKLS